MAVNKSFKAQARACSDAHCVDAAYLRRYVNGDGLRCMLTAEQI